MFDLTAEEARLLLNVALMATGANRFQSAAKIFAALEAFRPNSPEIQVGKAILFISLQQFDACVDFIDASLARFPEHAMLLAFKGMALKRLGRDADAVESLARAAGQREDIAASQLARNLLDDGGSAESA